MKLHIIYSDGSEHTLTIPDNWAEGFIEAALQSPAIKSITERKDKVNV